MKSTITFKTRHFRVQGAIQLSASQRGGSGDRKLMPLALEYPAVDNCGWRNHHQPAKFARSLPPLVARLPRNQVAVPVGGGSGDDSVMRGKIGCNSLQTGRGGFAIGASSDGKHGSGSCGGYSAMRINSCCYSLQAGRSAIGRFDDGEHELLVQTAGNSRRESNERHALALRLFCLREHAHRLCRNQSLERSNP